MGIINDLKVYIDERKKYKLELERKNSYKRRMIDSVIDEGVLEVAVYREELYALMKSDDVKYYIIDDDELDSLVIVGKNGNYVELFHGLPIKPKEELEKLIANKDYKGLIMANYSCHTDCYCYPDDYSSPYFDFDAYEKEEVAVYFAPGLIELTTEDAEEMIEDVYHEADEWKCELCETTYAENYYELKGEGGMIANQFCEVEKIIDSILEEKYFAEHPESAKILMKKRKKNK